MTPFELNVTAQGFNKRKEIEIQEKITLEYLNARWTIQWLGKKNDQPRPLKEILQNLNRKEMTDNDMLEKVKALNKMLGGEVRIVGK